MKTKAKSFLLLTAVLLWCSVVPAQELYEWSEPQPVTDSVSFNSNPSSWLINYDQLYLFYEKRYCDTCNSAIWGRNITTLTPESRMISGVFNYSYPLFYNAYSNLFKGFLLFLSDSLGNTEIYASVVENDFTIGETYQLTSSPGAKSHLITSHEYDNHPIIGWIQDSVAWSATSVINGNSISLENIIKIDSLSVTDLKYNYEYAYVQRKDGDSLHLYYHFYDYDPVTQTRFWQQAEPIDTTGNNTQLNLNSGSTVFGIESIVWVKENQLYIYSIQGWWGPPINTINTYNLPNISQPSLIAWDMPVKFEYDAPHVLTFSSGTGDNSEVYGSFGFYSDNDTTNITHNNIADSSPALFWGEATQPESNFVYVVWQSQRHGHTPLYFSKAKAYIGSGIDENNAGTISLNANPNPFGKQLEINVVSTKNAEINLSVFSLSGKAVWRKTVQISDQEIHTYDWNPGKQIPKGMYLIVAEQNGVKVTKRVVYR